MRGTAWVNAFQTVLFLSFSAIALDRHRPQHRRLPGGDDALLDNPATAPLTGRERVSPWFFFSYTFIPLSTIAFPHIAIFLTAKRLVQFKRTMVFYPHFASWRSWRRRVFLGVRGATRRFRAADRRKLQPS